MPKFVKCPRCEINYILEGQEYCEICANELRGIVVAEEVEDEIEAEICPRCRINFLSEGETICESCAAAIESKEKAIIDDVEPDWEAEEEPIDDETVDDDVDLSLDELAEEEIIEDDDEEIIDDDDVFVDIIDEIIDDEEDFDEEPDEELDDEEVE